MLLTNISDVLSNGTVGHVVSWNKHQILVEVGSTRVKVNQAKATEENVIFQGTRCSLQTLWTRRQFPLRIAYSMTIHKCQGLCLDPVIVDLSDPSGLTTGTVYTAVSRSKSLSGTYFIHPFAYDLYVQRSPTNGLLKGKMHCR